MEQQYKKTSYMVNWEAVCTTEGQEGDVGGSERQPSQGEVCPWFTLHHVTCDSHPRDRDGAQRSRAHGSHTAPSVCVPQDWPQSTPCHHTPLGSASSPGPLDSDVAPPQQSPASAPLQRSHLPCPLDSRIICPAHSCDTSLSRGFLSFLR